MVNDWDEQRSVTRNMVGWKVAVDVIIACGGVVGYGYRHSLVFCCAYSSFSRHTIGGVGLLARVVWFERGTGQGKGTFAAGRAVYSFWDCL